MESVSLTPPLRVGGSEVDRGELLALTLAHRCRRNGTYVPRCDAVDGIGIVRDADAVASQLFAESYRPGTGNRRGLLQRGNPLRQLLGPVYGRIPEPLPLRVVESGKDLTPPAIEDRQRQAVLFGRYVAKRNRRTSGLLNSAAEDIERADAPQRQPEADAETARGCDPDPYPGEGARAEAGRDQVDRVPAAGRRGCPLDLLQEPGRVPGPPLRGEAQLRLVNRLAVAPGAGDGVDGRGIETDDEQGCATP